MTIKPNSKLRKQLKKTAYKYAFLFGYATDNHKFHFSPKFILRGITVPLRMKPNFLIVGAAKSGTTSLYNYLIQHERILPAIKKEINYWNGYRYFGFNWYKGNFPIKSHEKITGEATTNYLKLPYIAQKIFEHLPKAKIIILLRDPIERSYSEYNYQKNFNKIETLTFEDALAFEEFRNKVQFQYRTNSIYVDQILPYFKIFPKNQIKILDFKKLINCPQDTMNNVCDFLNIPRKNDWKFKIHNKLEYDQEMKPSTKLWLSNFFKSHNKKLFKLLKIEFDWN